MKKLYVLTSLVMLLSIGVASATEVLDDTCVISVPSIKVSPGDGSFVDYLAHELNQVWNYAPDLYLHIVDSELSKLFNKGYYPIRIESHQDYEEGLLLNWKNQCDRQVNQSGQVTLLNCIHALAILRERDEKFYPVYVPRSNQVSADLSKLVDNIPNCKLR